MHAHVHAERLQLALQRDRFDAMRLRRLEHREVQRERMRRAVARGRQQRARRRRRRARSGAACDPPPTAPAGDRRSAARRSRASRSRGTTRASIASASARRTRTSAVAWPAPLFIITPQYALSGAVAMRTCAMPRAFAAAFADMPIDAVEVAAAQPDELRVLVAHEAHDDARERGRALPVRRVRGELEAVAARPAHGAERPGADRRGVERRPRERRRAAGARARRSTARRSRRRSCRRTARTAASSESAPCTRSGVSTRATTS